jgi:hypothetical protein
VLSEVIVLDSAAPLNVESVPDPVNATAATGMALPLMNIDSEPAKSLALVTTPRPSTV